MLEHYCAFLSGSTLTLNVLFYMIAKCCQQKLIDWFLLISIHKISCRKSRTKTDKIRILKALVKASSKKSNANGQISTPPRGSKTPERILKKPKIIYNYVAGMTTRANPCGAATTWVVSANTWHVTCFGFLGNLLVFLYSWDRAAPSPADRFWRSARHMVYLRARMCLLGSRCCHSPFMRSNPPKTLIWGGRE